MVTADPGADERRYAALTAAAIDAPLVEASLKPAPVDLCRAPRPPLPRPGLGALQQAIDLALMPEGERLGVDAFFGGGGGDNVFCYLITAAPAVDALLARGPGATVLAAIDNLAQIHGGTAWRAAYLTVKKALRRPRHPWRPDHRFTNLAAAPEQPDPHPWLDWPAHALPGKIEHVANLVRIQSAPDGNERLMLAPIRYPLLSQPVVELCLRIPSWMWISGGHNRSVARDAFRERLPAEIIGRRTKGEFSGFTRSIYARNRTVLADHLVGGWLDRAGLLDSAAIKTYLADRESSDYGFQRLLDIAGVETWARSWSDPNIAVRGR
jgi:asparagine synthase (glutamine-hydrolysing)